MVLLDAAVGLWSGKSLVGQMQLTAYGSTIPSFCWTARLHVRDRDPLKDLGWKVEE
jgi:hypothetical protein